MGSQLYLTPSPLPPPTRFRWAVGRRTLRLYAALWCQLYFLTNGLTSSLAPSYNQDPLLSARRQDHAFFGPRRQRKAGRQAVSQSGKRAVGRVFFFLFSLLSSEFAPQLVGSFFFLFTFTFFFLPVYRMDRVTSGNGWLSKLFRLISISMAHSCSTNNWNLELGPQCQKRFRNPKLPLV